MRILWGFHQPLLEAVPCPQLKRGSSSRGVLGWKMWSLWCTFGCFAASLYIRSSGDLLACSTRLFPLARGSGEAWSLHWSAQPHLGADWAWSLSWEGQSKLCILNLSQFFDLSSVSEAVRESACTPVTSFVPLRLDWWLLTELTQPCLCQKHWDIWISFSFYMLIWMSAHLCAC